MLKTIESFTYNFFGDLFIDIGGNIGMWSKELYSDYEKIIFIEPSEEALSKAKQNINDTVGKIDYIKKICSNEAGSTKTIWTPSEDSGQFTVFGEELYKDNFMKVENNIPTMRLDDLIDQPQSTSRIFIKIDTEGCDLDVILGGKKFIEKYRPTLAIEFHFHMYWDENKHKEVFDFFKTLNYKIQDFKFPGYRAEAHRLFDGKHNGLEMYDRHYHALIEPN
jgi:FkbM family methyltransferase